MSGACASRRTTGYNAAIHRGERHQQWVHVDDFEPFVAASSDPTQGRRGHG